METNSEEVAGTWSHDVVRLLAIEHSLDFGRVLSVLVRMWLTDDDYGPAYVDVVAEALSHLGPLETLKLLEQEDLEWLLFRIKSYGLLMNIRRAPVYSLAELAELAAAFVPYLESNREHLLKTGYPRTSFGPSAFFGMMLARLCYVKVPLRDPFYPREWLQDPNSPPSPHSNGPLSTHSRRLDDGSYEYDYLWAREEASLPTDDLLGLHVVNEKGVLAYSFGFLWGNESAYTGDWKPVTPCEYEDAALIAGLSAEDAARAERLRGKVLECKLGVLRQLASAARAHGCSGLWPGCVEVLTRNLSADDAAFLINLDRLCAQLRLGCEIFYGHSLLRGNLHTGGLSDVFTLIGHFEKEIAIGTMCKTKEAFTCLAPGGLPKSYYEAIGQPWQGALDQVIDRFFGLSMEEQAFWKSYQDRVNQVLEDEFYEELNLRVRVKKKLQHPYAPFAQNFLELTRTLQEDTGRLPELNEILAAPGGPSARCLFANEGDVRVMSYQGITKRLRDTLGMRYLAHLLVHPHTEVAVLDLVTAVHGPSAREGERMEKMGDAESAAAGFSLDAAAGEAIADKKYREQVKAEIQDLDDAIEDAEGNGNLEAVAYHKERKDEFMRRLASALGRRGRSRRFTTEHERARNAASHTIRRALNKIGKEHPLLHSHLSNSLTLGSFVAYRPDRLITWQV